MLAMTKSDLILSIEQKTIKPDFLLFWGHTVNYSNVVGKECLSQWYPCTFYQDGTVYLTAEHYMMAEKARIFKDRIQRRKILAALQPAIAKKLGRKVKGFNQKKWDRVKDIIIYSGNCLKFQQNPYLRDYLLSTENKILVEASPYDKIYGIGLPHYDRDAENPSKWRGENILGFTLMAVREAF